jgi:hypothetical protein
MTITAVFLLTLMYGFTSTPKSDTSTAAETPPGQGEMPDNQPTPGHGEMPSDQPTPGQGEMSSDQPCPPGRRPPLPGWVIIAGFVKDPAIEFPAGRNIREVNVTATNVRTSRSFNVQTDAAGSYRFQIRNDEFKASTPYDTVKIYVTHNSYNPPSSPAHSFEAQHDSVHDDKHVSMTQNCLGDTVRVYGATSVLYRDTLGGVFSAAADGEKMQSQDRTYTEDITCNQAISVSLSGGFNSCFTDVTGWTELKGTLTLTNGAYTKENIKIVP